ncbi:LysR family transcriptional regulator [Bradyrhizobium sp. LHD-71]|uniref:LysR family transcriptional regulator n=1 Tax=Bradyrhizobium sp. LHD-71 TaxID=3072141 RepID=UPI00280F5E34|nr:LysR family transcriptional regulator [Bradyrhizobium sp. LHD-71]MDQ8731469.1 LysR family transcriptional regulator [Bradyrhizobium sp. LHD-71]
MDWDDLKIVHAIARHGSLSAAARALRTTQPTVSRRLAGLERRIGAKLFERQAGGLSPGPLCLGLIEPLERMDEQAQAVARRIAARDRDLQGPITLTSLGWFGDDVLAPLLARFGGRHPQVRINLVNDARRFNLSRREADIAVRVGDFGRDDLVQRKLADVSYGLYASQSYLKRHGPPDFTSKCAGHTVISLIESPDKVVPFEWLKVIAANAHVTLRTNSVQSHIAAAEAGEAMAVLPRVLADPRANLSRIKPPLPEPYNPVRTGVHADLRNTPRVRSLIDFLAKELKAMARDLRPAD